jgi:ADP-heptose:LPS heptosyltransferase
VGIRLFSLQKFHGTDQLPPLAQSLRIDDLGAELDNGPAAFVETAAALQNLDLLICSDSAIAHLAGALGCPTWVVLPHAPDWRWKLETPESPWYPSMRLFRQSQPTDWKGVFQEVAEALREHYHSLRRTA